MLQIFLLNLTKDFFMKRTALMLILPLLSLPVSAEIVTKEIRYTVDTMTCVGFLAFDNSIRGKRPAVLVVHEWWGLNDFIKTQTKNLASQGYIAFAPDMYGNGRFTDDSKTAMAMASEVRGTPRMRQRILAGFKTLLEQPDADPLKTGAMGFCFGGSAVLELAYSGAAVKGTVTFHGGLFSPNAEDIKSIKTKFLILHGANDPTMKPDVVSQFRESLSKSGVDWQMVYFANTVHAFTNPAAGNDPSKGAAYNPVSARRAFIYMKDFFTEIFR